MKPNRRRIIRRAPQIVEPAAPWKLISGPGTPDKINYTPGTSLTRVFEGADNYLHWLLGKFEAPVVIRANTKSVPTQNLIAEAPMGALSAVASGQWRNADFKIGVITADYDPDTVVYGTLPAATLFPPSTGVDGWKRADIEGNTRFLVPLTGEWGEAFTYDPAYGTGGNWLFGAGVFTGTVYGLAIRMGNTDSAGTEDEVTADIADGFAHMRLRVN